MPTIRTIARPASHEPPKVKGSRFLAAVAAVESAGAALAVVEARRQEYPNATHHCYAWRLGTGRDAWRTGDDGEPGGTAGKPILQEIDARRLSDVVVVVTRWFGGTRLGTGGLIRAYGGAAAAALDSAGVVERAITESLRLAFAYEASGAVQGVLAAFGLTPGRGDYGAEVRLEVAVPVEDAGRLADVLRDATRGRIEITKGPIPVSSAG